MKGDKHEPIKPVDGWMEGHADTGPSMVTSAVSKVAGKGKRRAIISIIEEYGPGFGNDYVVRIEGRFKTAEEAKNFAEYSVDSWGDAT